MRRRLSAGVIAVLVGASACSADKGADAAKERPVNAATVGAEAQRHAAASNAPAAQATPPQPHAVDVPIHPPPGVAAPLPGSPAPVTTRAASRSGTTALPSPVQPTARPNSPRRVMLGDIDLTGVGYDAGSVTAPVVMIDFSDFGCPYCGEFTRETYPAIEREYVRTGKVFFKYVPFIVGMFPHAREATRAVECAGEQGQFWKMAGHVYEAQKTWKGGGDPRPLLIGLAAVVGADTNKVSQCYGDGRTDVRTARANEVANTIGVRVTPSFIVNGRPIQGALPLADFRKVIDAALLLRGMKQ